MRKALELPLAIWIYLVIPKRRQLEIYLNIVEWGPTGEFGAEAASHRAFDKPARASIPLRRRRSRRSCPIRSAAAPAPQAPWSAG